MTYGTQAAPTDSQPTPLPPVDRSTLASARRRTRSRDMAGYAFLLPYLLLFTTFLLLPLGYGLWLSVMRYELVSPEMLKQQPPQFVGLDNYREALHDPYFWKALGATFRFVGMTSPLTILLALALALGISTIPDKRQHIYRLAIFVPTMVTISVAGLLWRWLYSTQFGVFNAILLKLHLVERPVPFLTEEQLAMKAIVMMTLWWTVGGPVIILLAGIRQIPDVYYEAAALDGATGWRRLFHITLPLLKPVLLFAVVLNVIGAFQVFGQPYIITSGNPERSTLVLVQYIYVTSFLNFRLGYGAAMSWLLFVLIAAFSVAQFQLMREK
jgi:multiple sugar transport system permease protein